MNEQPHLVTLGGWNLLSDDGGEHRMILEGLTTTRNADGSINIAPLGPIVAPDFSYLTFRPFPDSVSYANLKRSRCGVFHVVDDVLLLVQTALDLPHDPPRFNSAQSVDGEVLADCCRWYEFEVESIDETGERPVMQSVVVVSGRHRDSFGFNRARHAVIEAVIAATRLDQLGANSVVATIIRSRSPVSKTGGEREHRALRLVEDFVAQRSAAAAAFLKDAQS